MSRLRILILAPDCNPDSICGPLVSYCQAETLARLHEVTLAIRSTTEEAVRNKQAQFRTVEVVKLAMLERIYEWMLRRIFKYDYRNQVLTALGYPFAIAFEWAAWRQFRSRIKAGEIDVVLRLLPIVTVLPSAFAFFLRKGPVPFVIGPVNGGLPWPAGFSQADNQKQWISGLRNLYRFLPFAKSTYRDATAIIAGSSHTYAELTEYREKLFFLPENGISSILCSSAVRSSSGGKLQLIFVGGLVPFKACDLALRAAAPLLKENRGRFTIVGDGPERNRLEQLTQSLGIEKSVTFLGSLSHSETMQRLRCADVLVFPSVREFGGAVVFEALAAGAIPIVADFGGPGDIVQPEVGYKVALTSEGDVVEQIATILINLAADRGLLERLRGQAISYARQSLSWEAKAAILTEVMEWAVRRGPKPDLPPPKRLSTPIDDQSSRKGQVQSLTAR